MAVPVGCSRKLWMSSQNEARQVQGVKVLHVHK